MLKASLFSRRSFVAASAALLAFRPAPVSALTEASAQKLVSSAVADINRIIASGKSEAAVLNDFKGVFRRYGDVRGIALTTLGPARREATKAEVQAYVNAFQTYFTKKYGRRFREFQGGEIVIEGTRPSKSYVEVRSKAILKGQQPFAVFWRVSERAGSPKIQNLIIGGINMLTNERNNIRSMLDRAKGDVGQLTEMLIARS